MTTDEHGWIGIVANPGSGAGDGRSLVGRLVREAEARGFGATVSWEPRARSALVARAEADARCRCLVAVGGDGTVASLINEQPSVPISALPAGTENLFAQHFGFPRKPNRWAELLDAGDIRPVDLGTAGGRRFVLMAGIGFDAEVVTRHHFGRVGRADRVRPTSRAAYVESVLKASFSYRFPPLTIDYEGPDGAATLRGTTAFVFNLPRYALGLPMAPTALENDGWLDLVVFRDPGPLQALRYLWLVWRGVHLNRPDVWHRRVARVTMTSDHAIPVQLDGDPAGRIDPNASEPWSARVLPGRLLVLAPVRHASASLVG